MLNEINQSVEDKYHIISLTCGIWWTNWTNKQNRDRLIDKEQCDSCGDTAGGGIQENNNKKKIKNSRTRTECGEQRVGAVEMDDGTRVINADGNK